MKLKRFIILTAGEKAWESGIQFVNAESEDQAARDFIDTQGFDLEDEMERRVLEDFMETQPFGIVEFSEKLFDGEGTSPEIEWYFDIDWYDEEEK